jgi:glycosyltransferase involved in cell wall biosynthesis
MKLIIQIPCLNEAESLPKTLVDLPKHIPGIDIIEVLIIDDGSTDGTADVAQNCGVNHIIRFMRKKGLANVFHSGLDACLKAGADIIVNTDADGQYKGEDIPRLIQPLLEKKADIVIGNRDIENIKEFSFLKKRLQRLGSWVVRQFSGSKVADATTGFRAYNRDAAMKLNIISDFTYTIESIIQAESKNLTIANITITTNPVSRPSRLIKSVPIYIKRSAATIVRVYSMFNPLKFFMMVSAILLFFGTLIGIRFLYFYIQGVGAGKLQSLLLAAVLIIVGFLMAVLGLISDLIAANRRLIEECLLRIKKIELRQNENSPKN